MKNKNRLYTIEVFPDRENQGGFLVFGSNEDMYEAMKAIGEYDEEYKDYFAAEDCTFSTCYECLDCGSYWISDDVCGECGEYRLSKRGRECWYITKD